MISFRPLLGVALSLSAASPLTAQEPAGSPPRPPQDTISPRDGARSAAAPSTRGYAVGIIDGADIAGAPSLSAALAARLPGVSVAERSGMTGAGARVWLRGPTSVVLNEPLLIVDGVRLHSSQSDGTGSATTVSRLDDIPPESVERIEILPGIAAAAAYGPGASKGAIVVTTKLGVPGPARWNAFIESGVLSDPTAFPANFGRAGTSIATGEPVASCTLRAEAEGTCTPGPMTSWNPLERVSPFETGWSSGAGVSVGGGSPALRYALSIGHDRATGMLDPNRANATSARVAIESGPTEGTTVSLTLGYRDATVHLPRVGGSAILLAGLRGEPVDDPVYHGYDSAAVANFGPYREIQDIQRWMLGVGASWRARSWLDMRFRFGLDESTRDDRLAMTTFIPRTSGDSARDDDMYTGDADPRLFSATLEAATRPYVLGRGVAAHTALAIDHWTLRDRWHDHAVHRFRDPDLDLVAEGTTMWSIRTRTTGVQLRQHVSWGERLFANASVRADMAPKSLIRFDDIVTPAIDVSWTIIGADDRPADAWLRGARLRSAWARGGDHLIVAAANTPPPSLPPVPPDVDEPVEHATEFEAGIDASLLGGRVSAALTWYSTSVERGIYADFNGPSTDPIFDPPLAGLEVDTQGWEALVTARVLSGARITWDAAATFWTGDQWTRFRDRPVFTLNGMFIGQGRLGGYWAPAYSYADADGDRRLAASELTVATEDLAMRGIVHPQHEASLRNTVRLGRLRVAAALDYRGGHHLLNDLDRMRCGFTPVCQEVFDPSTPLDVQARTIAASQGSSLGYLERGDYVRLREVSLSLPLAPGWLGGGARTSHFTITGRNVATWTSFGGLDPETASAAASAFTLPVPTTFSARLDIAW